MKYQIINDKGNVFTPYLFDTFQGAWDYLFEGYADLNLEDFQVIEVD